MSPSLDPFRPSTRTWFEDHFETPTEVQRRGWERIAAGRHALLVAPTGSGKTLAAFLWGIDAAAALAPEAEPGVRVLYVSPLKALVYDVERNLRAPLSGVQTTAERLGESWRPVRISVRTGDTPQRDRQRMARAPGEILVTTPESLFLILGARAREILRTVHTVIVDEIHSLAPTKRGTHLALSLERLSELCERDPQRIGLSATARPLERVARFLGGEREVDVVDASAAPNINLTVRVPVADMTNVHGPASEANGRAQEADAERPGGPLLGKAFSYPGGAPPAERGVWPVVYPELVREIRAHRSTIVFVNSRGLCERLAQRLNEVAEEELVLAHHGSVSHAKRVEIEDGLKAGRVRAIVATSSLELGIDMGAVDRVILIESPGSVARGLQRVGRAGHHVGAVSRGSLYPKFRGDLLESAVVAGRMRAGEIEALEVPRNPLDVLAQQVIALCCDRPRSVEEIEALVRRADPYRELSRAALESVLDMLSGRFPSSEFADLRPRLRWDRAQDVLSPRRGTAMLTRMNAGTIPDRGNFAVHLGVDGPRIGELDEEMVFESRAGDTFMLGASTWRVEEIERDRVVVSPAPGEPGRLPFWRGDGPGRPVELGRALGAFTRALAAEEPEAAVARLIEESPLDELAARNLVDYVQDQKAATELVPSDRTLLVERFRDELGDWRICLHSPFGSRVNGPWAMAIQRRLGEQSGLDVQLMYTDDGIVLRFADGEELPELERLLPDPDDVLELVTEEVGNTSLFASLFRENAVRSLLLTRRDPKRRNPLWAQRIKAKNLLGIVRRYPSFPVVIETYRQALGDVFDLEGLRELLRSIQTRAIRVHEVETRAPSPFARSLVFAYVAAYLYDGDAPLAERRAQALTLDKELLAELIGSAELRQLLDPLVVDTVEDELQGRAPHRRARDRDELADLLARVGDLSLLEIGERVPDDAGGELVGWLAELSGERRAVEIKLAGEKRWIAAADAGLYRDALGIRHPAGLPSAFLEAVPDALERVFTRYARSHGPFTTRALAQRYGLLAAQVEPLLALLETRGMLHHGEIRPHGVGLEWCDAEVLRQIKRRTLARLRNEVAAVDAATFGRFLPDWHGLRNERLASSGLERLDEVVAQLEGLPLPWSLVSRVLLPERIPGFTPELLDRASAAGSIVWIGRGALGARDGRVALYRRERVGRLVELDELPGCDPEVDVDAEEQARDSLRRAILAVLERRGASFLTELQRAVAAERSGLVTEEFEAALWDLVWAGRVTNDTFQPLRSLGGSGHRGSSRARARTATLAGGRWSLVRDLLDPAVDPTERAVARADMLLERYGVVSREAASAEELPGGFSAVYRTLRAMEEAGRIRRGHFIEGLSGAQFAHVGAVERLRAARREPNEAPRPASELAVQVLASQDPANPYGTLLDWPATGAGDAGRPRRVPGTWVVLVEGRPVLYAAPRRRALSSFPDPQRDPPFAVAFEALHRLPRSSSRRLLVVETIDGVAAEDSPLREALMAVGFVRDYRGFVAAGEV